MVAFGKKLKDRQIEEWNGYYINYKLMKKKVKQYARQIEAGGIERRYVLKDFSRMLDSQIEKIVLFLLEQQGLLASRLEDLGKQQDALQEEPDFARIDELREAYREVGRDLLKLLFFVEINAIGLRKILKKFDKRFGYRFTDYYVKTRANHPYSQLQQVFKHVGLGAVVGAISRNLAELQDRQGSYLSIYDQPALPLQDPVIDTIRAAVDRLSYSTNFLTFLGQHALIMQEDLPMPSEEPIDDERYHFMSLLLNLVNTFLYMVNTYIIVPTADDYSMSLGAAATVCGIVIGAMAVAQLFSSVYFSAWSNRSYFRPLIFSSIVLFVGNAMYALAYDFNSIAVLLLGRLFCGLGSARAVNRRYISDCVPLKIRMQASAGFVSASALGMACGPALAGLLQVKFKFYKLTIDQNTSPGWIMAFAWLIYLVWLWFSFREPGHPPEENHAPKSTPGPTTNDHLEKGVTQALLISSEAHHDEEDEDQEFDGSEETAEDSRAPINSIGAAYRLLTPSVKVQLLIYFMLKYAMEILLSESSVVTTYYFGWTTGKVAIFLACLGLTVLPVNMIVGSYISNMFEDRQILLASEIVVCLGILMSFHVIIPYSVPQYVVSGLIMFVSAEVLEGITEVDEWAITLAFPHGERLKRGSSLPGIYSFLPTDTVTNFPFIIQADFLLASSRENILWDNKWNQGILDCVPVAFVNAFASLVKSIKDAPVSSLPNMFLFLPIRYSTYVKLNYVRDAIKAKLRNETIVPCESYTAQKKLFRKPKQVCRLKPDFWSILNKARKQGVSLSNISSHGAYLLAYSFDKSEYNQILEFLEIEFVDPEWYPKCIGSSNLVRDVSEDVYIQLLVFIAEKWRFSFQTTSIKNTPLIKYVGQEGKVDLETMASGTNNLLAADSEDYISWLLNWNKEFGCKKFLPKVTQEAIESCSKKPMLVKWLEEEVKVKFVSVYQYADLLCCNGRKMAVTYARFLHKSLQKKYLEENQVKDLCSNMPIVDNYGKVTKKGSHGVLVPAKGSKWVELIGLNLWMQSNYIQLGEDYTCRETYFGNVISGKNLVLFLGAYVGASDVPKISPPNAAIPTLSSPLTKKNTFLLLEWLHNLRTSGATLPEKFLSSLKNGSWLKISLSGSPGYRPPSESFRLDSSTGTLLQNGSVLVDIPSIDLKFYGEKLMNYKDELRMIGVRFENAEACEYIGNRLMSLAASSMLTRDSVISILEFIKYLGANYISPGEFIKSVRGVKWVKTCQGDMTPNNSVLFSREWSAASQISNIPFIDLDYYGNQLLCFKEELRLLGVAVKFSDQIVFDNLKSSHSSNLTPTSVFALLDTLKNLKEEKEVEIFQEKLSKKKWLKTYFGYRFPHECLLFDSSRDSLLKRSDGPFIDEGFYGPRILSYRKELGILGVITDDANKACQLLAGYLNCHTNFETISRIYSYLSKFKWQPVDEDKEWIWIPKGRGKGEWVMPQECLLHDKNNLFGEQLYVLEKFKYGKQILDFFAETLNVELHPSVDDYCNLWETWEEESSGRQITVQQCCAFWDFVVRNWNPTTEDAFKNNLLKLPVLDPASSNGILLIDKGDVFIGDDLFLTDLFRSYSRPIFAWCPPPSLKSLNRTKLVEIYTELGVRTLSESVQKIISDVDHAGIKPVRSKEKIIKKGLLKLILAFLANPSYKTEVGKRHEAVSRVLAIEAFETPEKMSVRYRLSLSSGDVVEVEPRRMVRWDKQQSKLYMQKMDHKNEMEYAFHFAEEIAEGVLWENQELVPDLSELIRSGYLVEFKEEAIEFLMKMKNLQIFVEDQDYLASVFSSSKGNLQETSWAGPSTGQQPTPRPNKRRVNNDNSVTSPSSSSSYELRSTKSRKLRDTVSGTPVTIVILD